MYGGDFIVHFRCPLHLAHGARPEFLWQGRLDTDPLSLCFLLFVAAWRQGDSAVGPLSARLPARPSCSADGTLIMATDQSGPSQGHKTRPGQLARGATSVQKSTVINLIVFLGSDSNNN